MRRSLLPMCLCMALTLGACASHPPTAEDVHKAVKWSVIFGITPDADGVLQQCRFVESSDPRSASAPPASFTPSAAYIKQGCATLANARWAVHRDDAGNIKEVYDFCFYSTVVPDSPICDAKLSQGASKTDPAKP